MLTDIIKYRDLLWMLTLRDIRIRYKQAAMGFLWAIFMPIVAIFAGVLIKVAMSLVSGKPADMSGVVSIAVKTLPWTFFISSIRFAVQSLVGNSQLVTKIYFPRAVLPLASMLACLFDFLIAAVVLCALLAFAHIGLTVYILWLPVLLVALFLFTAGLGLLLSAANLFYRDVKYVVEIILMFGIFFTPVFYEAATFGKWAPFLLANPVGSILESVNAVVVLGREPSLFWLSYGCLMSVMTFWLGAVVFAKLEPLFAENI